MNGDDEEEEEETTARSRGRPNAWFAEHGLDNFGGSFRGTRPAPHGGSASVSPDDTAGAFDLCWCGQPFDHDWPGKAFGAKHPRKENRMSTPDTNAPARIERRVLRAYHEDLVDVITKAVNEYQVKYRITAHSVLLFPPDGTAPYTIHARSGDRQRKAAQTWLVRHCVPLGEVGKPARKRRVKPRPVDEEAIKELAEAMNSEEHLPKHEEPAHEEPTVEEPVKASQTAAGPVPHEEPVASEEWVVYHTGKSAYSEGTPHPFYVTNGVDVKCTIDGWIGKPRGAGGHTRTHHTDTSNLWGPEARLKSLETTRVTRIKEGVETAIATLQSAIGVEPAKADTKALDALTAENNKLRGVNNDLLAQIAELTAKVDDMNAKAALAREALGL